MSAMISTAAGDIGLAQSERQAMEWARNSTAPDSRFTIITGDHWASDRTSEWFPVLADRTSAATVQGYEWLPNGAYGKQVDSYRALQKCASKTVDCIEQLGRRRTSVV